MGFKEIQKLTSYLYFFYKSPVSGTIAVIGDFLCCEGYRRMMAGGSLSLDVHKRYVLSVVD